jgi:predicted CXXCH cytochrome family protein
MSTRILKRLIIGTLFALPLAIVPSTFAADGLAAPGPQQDGPTCGTCHYDTHDIWEAGAHGQAAVDPVFLEAWDEQGEPSQCLTCHASGYDPATGEIADMGVTCVACHGEFIEGHPSTPMPTYRSATTCDQCHLETYAEWKTSRHGQVDLACVACHDPHGAQIRADNPSDLCSTCHEAVADGFTHNVHNQSGLTCADCHLEAPDMEGEVHAARDHSFSVSLTACTGCHDFHSHEDWAIASESTPEPADVTTAAGDVQNDPHPVSPVGYAALLGIFGFAGGMILTPWLENLYRRFRDE